MLVSMTDSWREELQPALNLEALSLLHKKWLRKTLSATCAGIGEIFDNKFNVHVLDTLKVSYEQLQGCIDHEGALSLDEGTLATVIAMDRAGEMMRIDTIAEVSIALSRLSHGSFERKKQELSSLAAALPAFHAICVCEGNFLQSTLRRRSRATTSATRWSPTSRRLRRSPGPRAASGT